MFTYEELLIEAYKCASMSPDLSTQNGAIIISQNHKSYVTACNTIPYGVKITDERLQRPLKYDFTEHAESGVIHKAAKFGFATEGLTMICPWAACASCARAIITSGIKKLVSHQRMMDETPLHWKETIKYAFEMFKEAGIETILIPGVLNAVPIRFNGQIWYP